MCCQSGVVIYGTNASRFQRLQRGSRADAGDGAFSLESLVPDHNPLDARWVGNASPLTHRQLRSYLKITF